MEMLLINSVIGIPISGQYQCVEFRYKKTPPMAGSEIIDHLISNLLQLSSRFCKKYILLHADYSVKCQIVMFGIATHYNKDI
ncbi:hypothetical protein AYY16_01675 [Morganella psychrotolerans]|nr:hypothetical protein AYY16_01675 [Morganella psychrotolerans]